MFFRAAGILVILVLSFLVFFLKRDSEVGKTVILTGDTEETASDPATVSYTEETAKALLYVYLSGEIQKPGVYALPEGARLYEAVAKAGGLKPEADLSQINQAAFLEDGEHIHVPAIGETLPRSAEDPQSAVVNINTEGPDRLMLLPGIGEAKAAAIIRYRTTYGPFSSIEDIMNVSGIGKALFEQIKDRIRV